MSLEDFENKIYKELSEMIERKLVKGAEAHIQHIPYEDGTPEYVKMYRLAEGDKILSLISQPFDTYEQAKHFSDCFNDSFLYDSYCEEKDEKFYVYSGWLIKDGFIVYSLRSNGMYYEFANWS